MYTKSDVFTYDAAFRSTKSNSVAATVALAIFTTDDTTVIKTVLSTLDIAVSATVSATDVSSYISAVHNAQYATNNSTVDETYWYSFVTAKCATVACSELTTC